jgi:hypothetical protein
MQGLLFNYPKFYKVEIAMMEYDKVAARSLRLKGFDYMPNTLIYYKTFPKSIEGHEWMANIMKSLDKKIKFKAFDLCSKKAKK